MKSGVFYSKPRVIPGITRSGGFYGRFKGPNRELKFFDTSLSFSFDLTGEVPATGQLTLIPQGDTESSRDGRMAYVKSIQIRGFAHFTPGAAATAASTGYMLVVLDTQANGAAAGVTDVLTSNVVGTALTNIANSGRFRILKRFKFTLNAMAGVTTAYNNVVRTVDWFKKCDYPITYSSTSGAITEIRSNNLFLITGTEGTSDDTISFSGNCRLRFYD